MKEFLIGLFLFLVIVPIQEPAKKACPVKYYRAGLCPWQQTEQPVKEDKPDCNCINGIDL